MGKIEISDDCLAPARYVYMDYTGKNPYGVAKKISESLEKFFHISGAGVAETYFMWDNSGDPQTFHIKWWVKKTLSGYSTLWLYIIVKGDRAKETNEGMFNMRINAIIKTQFKGFSLFLKPIWYIYSLFFYNNRRREYINLCKNFALSFRNEMREHYNLEIGMEHGER